MEITLDKLAKVVADKALNDIKLELYYQRAVV